MMDCYIARPPYDGKEHLASGPAIPKRVPLGALLVLVPAMDTTSEDVCSVLLKDVVRESNATPVLLLDRVSHELAIELAFHAGRLGVVVVAGESALAGSTLRSTLAQPDRMYEELIAWLTPRVQLNAAALAIMGTIAKNAAYYRTFTEFVPVQAEIRRWGRCLRSSGLAPPGKWLHALHIIRIALAAQADPTQSLARLAETFGYADERSLRHRFLDVLGVGIRDIRSCCGMRWMLHLAARRNGLILEDRATTTM